MYTTTPLKLEHYQYSTVTAHLSCVAT